MKEKRKIIQVLTVRLTENEAGHVHHCRVLLNQEDYSKTLIQAATDLPYYMEEFDKLTEQNKKLFYEKEELRKQLEEITGAGDSGSNTGGVSGIVENKISVAQKNGERYIERNDFGLSGIV